MPSCGSRKMKASKLIAIIALAWSVIAPLCVLITNDDEQGRQLEAMGALKLNALSEDKTNNTLVVPIESVDRIKSLAKRERIRTSRYTLTVFASSAVIALLAILLLSRPAVS